MAKERVVGVGGVAELLGLKPGTVYVMKSNGKLPDPDRTCECEHASPLWKVSTIERWNEKRKHGT